MALHRFHLNKIPAPSEEGCAPLVQELFTLIASRRGSLGLLEGCGLRQVGRTPVNDRTPKSMWAPQILLHELK